MSFCLLLRCFHRTNRYKPATKPHNSRSGIHQVSRSRTGLYNTKSHTLLSLRHHMLSYIALVPMVILGKNCAAHESQRRHDCYSACGHAVSQRADICFLCARCVLVLTVRSKACRERVPVASHLKKYEGSPRCHLRHHTLDPKPTQQSRSKCRDNKPGVQPVVVFLPESQPLALNGMLQALLKLWASRANALLLKLRPAPARPRGESTQ
jgi:hypothetical protein